MSISQALHNAVSGLTVSTRAAELVSNNVANAMTEGYGRREILLSSQALGGQGAGVKFDGVDRVVNQTILQDRWRSDAALGQSSVRSEFYSSLESLVGAPTDPDSLGQRVDALESSLLEAASRPESAARLLAVAGAAEGLTTQLNRISSGIQDTRMDAERRIDNAVSRLNSTLGRVEDLNKQIMVARQSNRDVSALLDQRQQAVDEISEIVPIRVMERDHDRIALYTMNGEKLIDGQAAKFGFERSNTITPEMSLSGGTLSALTVDGRTLQTDRANGPMAGGSLAALFEVRDDLAVSAQTQLDAMARDFVERFADPAVDPSLLPGDPGLLTDVGVAFDPLNEVGLAGRISVNPAVLPGAGGDLWRLRDGINALAPGEVGNARLLNGLADALTTRRTAASGDFPVNQTASGLATDLLSEIAVSRLGAERSSAYAVSQQETLKSMQLDEGVDTDAEMQKLMLIEQSFAANARVVTVADEMLQLLMGI